LQQEVILYSASWHVVPCLLFLDVSCTAKEINHVINANLFLNM